MAGKGYIRSDGNGGINMSNGIAILMVIMVFLGMVIPSAVAYGILNNKVNHLENTYEDAGPRHTSIINELNDEIDVLEKEVNVHEKDIALNDQRMETINQNLEEIKADIKDLKKQIGGIST